MNVFNLINSEAKKLNLSFLIIGGHAAAAHGSRRHTYDVDMMILSDEVAPWTEALTRHGYRMTNLTSAFAQFYPPAGLAPIDFMIVNASTWEKLKAESELRTLEHEEVFVPSALHMLALKIHATIGRPNEPTGKDWHDILAIIRGAKIDVHASKTRLIVQKYGGVAGYQTLLRKLEDAGPYES